MGVAILFLVVITEFLRELFGQLRSRQTAMKKISLKITLLTLSMFVPLSLGCGSDNLTKDKAKDIIIKHFKYPLPAMEYLSIGSKVDLSENKRKKMYEALAKEGLITMKLKKTKSDHEVYKVYPTKKGEKYTGKEFKTTAGRRRQTIIGTKIKAADRQFVEVTKIELSGIDKEAIVEFTWKYGKLTPFGKHWESDKNAQLKYDENKNCAEKVKMRLYDDGWRVVK